MSAAAVPFRFDAEQHRYTELATGRTLPSITQMLKRTGHVDDEFFTEDSRIRGHAVHKLTADYDLGALDPAKCVSQYRGYLLGYVAATNLLKPQGLVFHAIEEPLVHPVFRFGGTPDRDVTLFGLRGVTEIKSGVSCKSHPIQTALQAMLVATVCGLPAESLGRWCLYLKANGKFKMEQYADRRDFTEAQRVIRACCR